LHEKFSVLNTLAAMQAMSPDRGVNQEAVDIAQEALRWKRRAVVIQLEDKDSG
jgi:hypothetical protein